MQDTLRGPNERLPSKLRGPLGPYVGMLTDDSCEVRGGRFCGGGASEVKYWTES